MRELADYFVPRVIISALVRRRLEAARHTRKENFFTATSGLGGKKNLGAIPPLEDLRQLLPPRRHWPRPYEAARRDLTSDPSTAQAKALSRYALGMYSRAPSSRDFPWQKNLRTFVDKLRLRARTWTPIDRYEYKEIRVTPKKGRDLKNGCRILAIYSLSDTILASCFAAYFRDRIDAVLDKDCLAFRPPKEGVVRTHNDAIERIYTYHAGLTPSDEVFVSECDIKGFFDSVSHDVIRRELEDLCVQHSIRLDELAWDFLDSFLNGYSYTLEALANADLKVAGRPHKKFFDPRKELLSRSISPDAKHGIPQGSALSCVLANVVLASADSAVRHALGEGGLYLRYCDDIVISHKSAARCSAAKEAYTSRLDALKLPYHPFSRTRSYGESFWLQKSKDVYSWREGGRNSSPWLAFVGYQIHRDGRIRVRKGSVDKEIEKQREAAAEIAFRIRKQIKAKAFVFVPGGILYRLMLHLVSFGVGTPSGKYPSPSPNGKSWMSGFIQLRGRDVDTAGLRRLDRSRTNVLAKMKQYVRSLKARGSLSYRRSGLANEAWLRFAGNPLSYSRQATQPPPTAK